ncbi:hypothetical protein GEOBRER4_n0287 [Citrifermentans bremense]|uniref:Uncharacterized protein n=1 Tax=Citrifermentans bremense TaxID=60035 RepID=A0A6S6LXI6_9BACT|nr:hypothetical protein [Citrifermentans bremense]BCG45530.1 hypothetical protein GEOBRER4_n0287 [Citrifermentans bremense]
MRMTKLPKPESDRRSPLSLGCFAACFVLSLAALLAPARQASSSYLELPAAPAASASQTAAPAAPVEAAGFHLLPAQKAAETARFRSQFRAEYPNEPWSALGDVTPSFVLQQGEYGGRGYGVLAEMGDIRIKQTPNTLNEAAGRGGRFALLTGNSGNRAKLETFAASGVPGASQDDLLVGATGELSLMSDSARLKTIFLSGRRALDGEGRWPSGAKKGDVLGLVAAIDPFGGRLAAEAELDYSSYDGDTADETAATRDSARRLKFGGEWGGSRYSALYERTGPRYRLLAGDGPERDSEGVAFGLGHSFELHSFDVKLSRYNDNTEKNDLSPRLYRYEGLVDYHFRGASKLPLSLQYRKRFIDSTKEPLGYLPREVEEDAVSGKLNLLAGGWDLGLRGGVSQRTDKLRRQRESSTQSVGFLPKFTAAGVTVLPDLSLKRVMDYSNSQRTDQYSVNLGLNGTLLEKRLGYEVKGGYKEERTGATGTGKQVVGAKVKAAYPLARFFKWLRPPTLGVKGEFKEINDRAADSRESDFSLLISLDGGTFM